MIKTSVLLFIGATICLFSFRPEPVADQQLKTIDVSRMSVEEVLGLLGDGKMIHSIEVYDPEKAQMGEDLVLNGRTLKDGKRTKRISRYFVCTDCHNVKREFESLDSESPEDRLEYASKNGLPFLPGSTFFGIYNRTSFYNDDYIKKYGDLVINSRDSLDNAIQLCAKYCSSGRYLEDWEVEAITHYYKKNELRIADLNLSGNTLKNIRFYNKLKEEEKKSLIEEIKGSYRQAYSATFLPAMPVEERKFGEGGDPVKGEQIYNSSCLHCHAQSRVTYLSLDHSRLTARMFQRNLRNYTDKSLYQIIRWGTYSKAGRKQYMPLFTKEKMSDTQINDLVAYINQLAGK